MHLPKVTEGHKGLEREKFKKITKYKNTKAPSLWSFSNIFTFFFFFKAHLQGSLGGATVWRLPLAQGAILETRDRIPRRAPGAWSLLLALPLSLSLSL